MRPESATSQSKATDVELRSLNARVLQLERERSDARDRARLLVALQTACTTIAVTRAPDEVIAHMLRAAHDPLGFARGIYFSVDRARGVNARWQIDASEHVESSAEVPDLRPNSAILRVLRGEVRESVGIAGELSSPLVDVRNWYVLSALAGAEGTQGVLYVDGYRSKTPREWEAGLVHALTTIAAVSLDNSILFARTHELATRDSLTGLLNRRAFAERLEHEIALCRSQGCSLTYVMIDVDNFKAINDTRGHAHGDAVLQQVANNLRRSSRSEDVVGRFAGDEFVVLLTNVDPVLSFALVNRLSQELREQSLSCSIGAALFPRDANDVDALATAADRALYATKAAGKNGFSFAQTLTVR